ncbi:hypothetical protein EJ05DRAFT_481763 [Pseudovirgaria hyperparasitica]|uniref:Apple domain-containing protein n=1 Tax=Pseudovirgaria hyperparasitica TaxID=470096 RepID=A0A6A6WL30_9PEZI|nr:uncharacterized protein EJ05DRAFT_481763 [Pseudovirgaria hyperparasitica]KAF2762887.1 hypothetical protein EJ05DRAFT_481763 [Pseudovirgaria hyperparasitica]
MKLVSLTVQRSPQGSRYFSNRKCCVPPSISSSAIPASSTAFLSTSSGAAPSTTPLMSSFSSMATSTFLFSSSSVEESSTFTLNPSTSDTPSSSTISESPTPTPLETTTFISVTTSAESTTTSSPSLTCGIYTEITRSEYWFETLTSGPMTQEECHRICLDNASRLVCTSYAIMQSTCKLYDVPARQLHESSPKRIRRVEIWQAFDKDCSIVPNAPTSATPTSETPTPTPTPEPISETPTPTPTPEPISETPTPTPTPEPISESPSPTPTPQPTSETPTPTPTPEPTSETPTPTPTPVIPPATCSWHGLSYDIADKLPQSRSYVSSLDECKAICLAVSTCLSYQYAPFNQLPNPNWQNCILSRADAQQQGLFVADSNQVFAIYERAC